MSKKPTYQELENRVQELEQAASKYEETQHTLEKSRNSYQTIFDAVNDAILIQNIEDGSFLDVNQKTIELLGYTKDELLHMDVSALSEGISPYSLAKAKAYTQKAAMGESQIFEWNSKKKDGTFFPVEVNLKKSILDGQECIIAVVRDISVRKEAIDKLKTSIEEKDILLRELYHRTKNTLQVIRSMLVLQAATMLDNDQVQKLVADTEQRILTISLVHQKLYQSQDLSRISLQDYLQELAQLIIQGYTQSTQHISITVESEPLILLLDTAIPCGLIVNELLSNALKYAFPDNQPGKITIRVFRNTAANIEVSVSDTGVGVPSGFNFREQTSLGLRTVFAIGEQQLQGQIQFTCTQGVTCTIEFPDTLYNKRV